MKSSKIVTRYFLAIFCLWLIVWAGLLQAATWVKIDGYVRLADGTPICSMVLANGEYIFSCDGAGSYHLTVPLDTNGEVTLFAFADGFAPYSVTESPRNLPSEVEMVRAAPNSPEISLSMSCSAAEAGWINLLGQVKSGDGAPLCAMVLANGEHIFSCDVNHGAYDLTVPVDTKGNVTLFAFADGFQPYTQTFSASSCGSNNKSLVERLIGVWDFTYQIISVWVDRYSLVGPAVESPVGSGEYYLFGTDEWDDLVAAKWAPSLNLYALLDPGITIDQFYTFNLTSQNNVLGCYYLISKSTGDWSACYQMTGVRVDAIASLLSDSAKVSRHDEELQYQTELSMMEESSQITAWSAARPERKAKAQAQPSNRLMELESYDELRDLMEK